MPRESNSRLLAAFPRSRLPWLWYRKAIATQTHTAGARSPPRARPSAAAAHPPLAARRPAGEVEARR